MRSVVLCLSSALALTSCALFKNSDEHHTDYYTVGPNGESTKTKPQLPDRISERTLVLTELRSVSLSSEVRDRLFPPRDAESSEGAMPTEATLQRSTRAQELTERIDAKARDSMNGELSHVGDLHIANLPTPDVVYRIEAVATVNGINMLDESGSSWAFWESDGGSSNSKVTSMEIETEVTLHCHLADGSAQVSSGKCKVVRKVELSKEQQRQISAEKGQASEADSATQQLSQRHILGAVASAMHGAAVDLITPWATPDEN